MLSDLPYSQKASAVSTTVATDLTIDKCCDREKYFDSTAAERGREYAESALRLQRRRKCARELAGRRGGCPGYPGTPVPVTDPRDINWSGTADIFASVPAFAGAEAILL